MKIKLTDGSGTADLKYLLEEALPSGAVRIRFRRKGRPTLTLRSPPGSAEFMAEYRNAMAGIKTPPRSPSAPTKPVKTNASVGSLRWLCERYFEESDDYLL